VTGGAPMLGLQPVTLVSLWLGLGLFRGYSRIVLGIDWQRLSGRGLSVAAGVPPQYGRTCSNWIGQETPETHGRRGGALFGTHVAARWRFVVHVVC
jgi:hypothetical protein